MQLKITPDYAVRAMLYLAARDRVVSSGEVSHEMAIPHQYLINIMGSLRRAGLIDTHPGINGGYSLSRGADEITLLDIICAMEGTVKISRCLEKRGRCSRKAENNCPVKQVYDQIQESMENCMSAISLADLVKSAGDSL